VRNLIRGLSPFPTAWSNLVKTDNGEETMVKLFFAQLTGIPSPVSPGKIVISGDSNLRVACGDEFLEITDLQLSGKKRMGTREFLNGFRGIEGCFFH
jgi:methionyl-tRNA formyltransferase